MNRFLLFIFSLFIAISCSTYTWDYPNVPSKSVSVSTLSKKQITIGQGKPAEIIHFWAYNHPLSRQSLAYMNQLAREAKEKNLTFVAVCLNWAGTESEITDFLKSNRLGFDCVFDSDSRLETQYRVTSIPQTIIIKNNTVTHRLLGLREDIDYPSEIVDKASD